MYWPLVLCHYVHCYLLNSAPCLSLRHNLPYVSSASLCPKLSFTVLHCLSVRPTLPSLCSLSPCPLLSSTVFRLLVSTSHSTVCPLSVLHTVLSLFLCHCFHCCLLQSVHCKSVLFFDSRQFTYYLAAVTPSAALQ